MTTAEQLRKLAAEATPGPWRFNDTSDHRGSKGEFRAPSPWNGIALVSAYVNEADMPLAALAPSLAVALAAAVEYIQDLRMSDGWLDQDIEDMDALLARVAGMLEGGEA